MAAVERPRQYDLEERTLRFAKRAIEFTDRVSKTLSNVELIRQLVRSAGSVGANYIEANESLSKRDFVVKIKVCRKEAKESTYWLKLIRTGGDAQEEERKALIQEATELMKIFGAILVKSR